MTHAAPDHGEWVYRTVAGERLIARGEARVASGEGPGFLRAELADTEEAGHRSEVSSMVTYRLDERDKSVQEPRP